VEIKILSRQLQEQKDLITKLEHDSVVAREPKQELELEKCILKMTEEAAELRDKLEEAEEGRWEAVKEMEAAQVEIKLLQYQVAKLREYQVPYSWFIIHTLDTSARSASLIPWLS